MNVLNSEQAFIQVDCLRSFALMPTTLFSIMSWILLQLIH